MLLCALFITLGVNAQVGDIGKMLSGSMSDGSKLMQAYLKPFSNAFGANLNAGWYNTAKPHKLLGFDLTASVSVSFIPSADRSFDASKIGLSVTPSGGSSPTIAGKKESGQTITYSSLGNLHYNTPQGTNMSFMISPMFQLGLGLIKETDVTVRYVPDMNVKNFGTFGLWGVGLKHSIKQYIPGIKMMPFFHLSAFLGYTQLKTNANLSFTPADLNSMMSSTLPDATNGLCNNQKMELLFKGFTGNILASFDLPVITFYGGVGIATTSTNMKLAGYYPIPNTAVTQIVASQKDPINIKMSSSSGSVTKPRLNAGVKFKMAIVTLHFDYTLANYSVVTAGLGISFR